MTTSSKTFASQPDNTSNNSSQNEEKIMNSQIKTASDRMGEKEITQETIKKAADEKSHNEIDETDIKRAADFWSGKDSNEGLGPANIHDAEISGHVTELVNKYLTASIGRNIFTDGRIALLVECYRRYAGKNVNKDVIKIFDQSSFISGVLTDNELDFLSIYLYKVFNLVVTSHSGINKTTGVAIISQEIIDFMCNIIEFPKDETVYNPFAGVNSLALSLPNKVVGEEINPTSWAIGQIGIYAKGCLSRTDIKLDNSFNELKNPSSKFDKIIMCPPFGLKDSDNNEYTAVIDALENKLKEDGELLVLLPNSFTFSKSGSAFTLRKYLLEKKYVASIITLPPVLYGTIINPCLVAIKKCKQEGILFLDFSTLMTKDKYVRHFSYKAALEAIEQGNQKYGKFKSYDEIKIEKNFNINPAFHLFELPKFNYPILPLSKLIKPLRQKIERDIEANFISINEIGSNHKNNGIQEVEVVKQKVKSGISVLPSKLALFRHPILKFCIIPELKKSNNLLLLAPMGTEVFEVIDSVVSKEYLEAILNKSFIMDQIEIQERERFVSNRINLDEIFVPIPDKENQEEIIAQYEADVKKRYSHLANIYSERAGIRDMAKDLKHMLGTPFSNVFNAISCLERVVGTNEKAIKYLTQLKDNLGYAKRIIIRDGVDFNNEQDFPKQKILVREFFQNYKKGWDNYGSFSFDLEVDDDLIDDDDYIFGNADALRIMLDALLENAHRHGFLRKYKEGNYVRICLFLDNQGEDSYLQIQVDNNGKNLPEDFTLDSFITSGKYNSDSGHTGLGGNHIFEITKSLGGKILIPFIEDRVPVFQFYLPANKGTK